MSYTPTIWADGDVISAEKMNHLEQGVANEQVGPQGPPGPQGPSGSGVPDGGSAGQILAKKTEANQDTQWVNGITSPTVNKIQEISQADYDALAAKDPNTLYLIEE